MLRRNIIILTFALCQFIVIDQSEAMYGLCSTDWFGFRHCFDFHDECKNAGGKCFYDGTGDHGEGCVCKKKVRKEHPGQPRYTILHKSHFRK